MEVGPHYGSVFPLPHPAAWGRSLPSTEKVVVRPRLKSETPTRGRRGGRAEVNARGSHSWSPWWVGGRGAFRLEVGKSKGLRRRRGGRLTTRAL